MKRSVFVLLAAVIIFASPAISQAISYDNPADKKMRLLQKSKNVIPEVLNRESRVSRENGNLIPLIVPPIKSGDSVWIPAFAGMTDFRHENILLQEPQTNMQFTETAVIIAYEYRPAGRRDPFAPLVVKPEPVPVKEPRPLKPRVPLESYDVKEFRLIATLWNKAGYYALIKLPDGKSYTIREGMKLGLHGGKVYKITKDSVIIREKIRDHRGVLVPRDTILKLRPEDKG